MHQKKKSQSRLEKILNCTVMKIHKMRIGYVDVGGPWERGNVTLFFGLSPGIKDEV